MNTVLSYHPYRYYPYERDLALREAATVFGSTKLREHEGSLEVQGGDVSNAAKLAYFAKFVQGSSAQDTLQARLERATTGHKRQATRYSVHGLHEYKGKFNPQIAKALLNISGVGAGSRILDPFCGSGTTLIEAAHLGARAQGYDINPFAVFLANAKLLALHAPAEQLRASLARINQEARTRSVRLRDDARTEYLLQWFDLPILKEIEAVGTVLAGCAGDHTAIFQVIASNLLRDYSQQDPNDLRIRRRKSPLPTVSFTDAFAAEADRFIGRLATSQGILGPLVGSGTAVLRDTTTAVAATKDTFDAAITSPPYAMALPYIDTQRLSLVWLGLAQPKAIATLENTLIGSRDMRGTSRRELEAALQENADKLPAGEIELCRLAARSLAPSDGFRRRAVPPLLYRYFCTMRASFRSVYEDLRPGAPYMLVVGHNHTVLGGERIDIDTPHHLASLAMSVGWKLDELVPLQTYQRWGYHAGNAVAAETLIILRRP